MTSGVALLFAAPLGFLVIRNLSRGGDFVRLATSPATLGPLARSLLLGITVTIAAAVIGTLSAWLVVRTDVRGARLWRVLLALPLVIPSFIGAFSLLAAFAPGGLIEGALAPLGVARLPEFRGYAAASFVLTLLTFPYVYLPVAARLDQLSPSLEESARLLGRRPLEVFTSIVLPQIRGAVLAGSLLVFLYTISDFGAVQLLRYDTLTRAIFETRVFDSATSLTLSLQLGLLAILIAASERGITKGPTVSAGPRAVRGLRLELGRWRAVATAVVAATVGLALLAPVAVLTFWSVRGLVRGSGRASAVAADVGQLVAPAVNTAVVSVVSAVVAVIIVLPVAYLTVRRPSRTGGVANAVVVGGFALPGLAIALALTFWTLRTPGPLRGLYQTMSLLVFAYVVHFGAQALRTAQVAVAGIPPRLEDAARSLGAGRMRRLWTLELPLMTPGLLAGAGLVLLSTMKELPATLLLAPAGFETLATRIWVAAEDAFVADASIASLILIALSGVLTWILVIRRSAAL
ncbi:MAG: iron ABC transporter permease [Actinobacteria bacterium]|nr:iron ABC transporter permease [Actinomycetota bacterium]